MDVAELIEIIMRKRNELDDSRGVISDSLLKVLEEEISEMELALANGDADKIQHFIDECAG